MNVTTPPSYEIDLWQLPADRGRYILLRFTMMRLAGTRDRVRVLRDATGPLTLPMLQAQIDALGEGVPVVVHVGSGWNRPGALVGRLTPGPAGA